MWPWLVGPCHEWGVKHFAEPRPDLVTGAVFKTVVGAPQALGRVRFPCGSAIFSLAIASIAHAAPVDEAVQSAAKAVALAVCGGSSSPDDVARESLKQSGCVDAQVAVCTAPDVDALQGCIHRKTTALAPNVVQTASV